jgi:preprotein translocase subunit SecE
MQRRWGGGVLGFIRESIGELRKVEWPGQNQVVQGTVVVIIACIIIGSYLYLADQAFSKFVSKVLLGQ